MKVKVDVRGYKATLERIRDGISDGMEDTAEELVDEAEEDAKDVLSETRRIWRREVYHGFEQEVDAGRQQASARLANYAPHATVVERGADYGAVGPPVQALIPWVAAHMGSGAVDPTDGGGGDGDGGSSPDGDGGDTDELGNLPDGTDPDEYPNTIIPGSAETHELSQYGAEPSWRFSPDDSGFNRSNTWETQNVVIYNNYSDEYYGGTIKRRSGNEVIVEYDTNEYDTVTISDGPGYSQNAIIAGERWSNLTDSEKDSVIDTAFNRIPRSSQLNDLATNDVDQVIGEYKSLVTDRSQLLEMAHSIEEIVHATETDGSDNPHVYGGRSNSFPIGLLNPDDADNDKRSNGSTIRTVRHEFGHAFMAANGYHYARQGDAQRGAPNEWDANRRYRSNRRLPWDWAAQGGPDEWHFDTDNDTEMPDPRTYYLMREDQYKGPNPLEIPNYDPHEEWAEYVYKHTLLDAQEVSSEPDFDASNDLAEWVLHPDKGYAEKGDWLRLKLTDSKGVSKEFDVEALDEVRKYDPGEFSQTDPDGFEDGIKVRLMEDKEVVFQVEDDGTGFVSDKVEYIEYAGKEDIVTNDWRTELEDVPEDPGLIYEPDTLDAVAEGLNRTFLRSALASETYDDIDFQETVLRREYSITNGQEQAAALFETILGSATDGDETLEHASKYVDEHPELLYALTKNFNLPDRFKNAMEEQTGLDWDEILREVDPNFSVPGL